MIIRAYDVNEDFLEDFLKKADLPEQERFSDEFMRGFTRALKMMREFGRGGSKIIFKKIEILCNNLPE